MRSFLLYSTTRLGKSFLNNRIPSFNLIESKHIEQAPQPRGIHLEMDHLFTNCSSFNSSSGRVNITCSTDLASFNSSNSSQSFDTFPVAQADEKTIGKAVFVIIALFLALMGNVFIIFSFFHNFKMRTITNTLVVNLCFTDTFSCALDLLYYIALIGLWPFTEDRTVCKALVFFDHLLKVASILSMMGIALDRYINLVRTSRRRMTLERARIIISWCWIQSLVAAIPWNELSNSAQIEIHMKELCANFPYFFEPGMGLEYVAPFFKITCVLLPVLIIYYVSYRIIKAVRRKRKVEVEETTSGVVTGMSTERFAVQAFARSGVTATILFGMYIVCTAPFILAILWTLAAHQQILSPQCAFAVYLLVRFKCVLFPILYISRNRTIMGYIREKLSCCPTGERKLMVRRQETLTFVTRNSSMQMFSRNQQRLGASQTLPSDTSKGSKAVFNNFVDIRALERSSVSAGNL